MKNEKINNTAKGKEALLKAKTLVIQGATLKKLVNRQEQVLTA